jgi:hypothetical protein
MQCDFPKCNDEAISVNQFGVRMCAKHKPLLMHVFNRQYAMEFGTPTWKGVVPFDSEKLLELVEEED